MTRWRWLPVMIALLFLPSLAGAQTRVGDKTGDKVRFGETQIIVDSGFGATRLKVMFARTPDQLRQGLMYRTTIKPWDGMLFDMGIVQPGNFWMRNTLIPLDIIFIKADGTVDSIGEGVPLSLKPVASKGPIRGVLEVRKGRAAKLGIKPGSIIRHEIFGNRER